MYEFTAKTFVATVKSEINMTGLEFIIYQCRGDQNVYTRYRDNFISTGQSDNIVINLQSFIEFLENILQRHFIE